MTETTPNFDEAFNAEALGRLQSYGLSAVAIERLSEICRTNLDWRGDLRALPPMDEQIERLKEVIGRATALQEAMHELPSFEWFRIWRHGTGEVIDGLLHGLRELNSRSKDCIRDLRPSFGPGNYKSDLIVQVSIVGFIADALAGEPMKVSRYRKADGAPSPFLAICEVCFESLRIFSPPDRAIRTYLERLRPVEDFSSSTKRKPKSKAAFSTPPNKKPPSPFPT